MIGTGLRLTSAATPAANARPTTTRMASTGLRSSRRTVCATGVAGGRTASLGAATGCARGGRLARPDAFAAAGDGAATVGGDGLVRGLAWPLRLAALTRPWLVAAGGTVGLGVAARFSCGRTTTWGVTSAGCLATSRVAMDAWRAGRGTATVTGGGSSSTSSTGAGSAGAGSAGAGCGVGVSPVTGGGGAVTGGSDTGAGGGGAGVRAGSRPSGSTYPFGSAATRTPRWTCGCRVTASLLSPTTPTSVPSVRVLPRSTLVAPSWSNVTA